MFKDNFALGWNPPGTLQIRHHCLQRRGAAGCLQLARARLKVQSGHQVCCVAAWSACLVWVLFGQCRAGKLPFERARERAVLGVGLETASSSRSSRSGCEGCGTGLQDEARRGRALREPACQSAPACRLFAGPASGTVCAAALCIAVMLGSIDALSSVQHHEVSPGGAGQTYSSLCIGADKPLGSQAAGTPVLKHLYDALVRQMRQAAKPQSFGRQCSGHCLAATTGNTREACGSDAHVCVG